MDFLQWLLDTQPSLTPAELEGAEMLQHAIKRLEADGLGELGQYTQARNILAAAHRALVNRIDGPRIDGMDPAESVIASRAPKPQPTECKDCGLLMDRFGVCPQADPVVAAHRLAPVFCGKSIQELLRSLRPAAAY